MKQLWAPWRIKYIAGAGKRGCFLCSIFRSRADAENLVLRRGASCGLLMNLYPYTNGHLLVAPFRHVATLEALNDIERSELMALASEACSALRRALRPDGFNIGINIGAAAGAGVKSHIHLHVVPRWNGDTNFLPVLADTKVIPQSLSEVQALLADALRLQRRRRKGHA